MNHETAPASDLARHWDGYKVGGIKPAWEPIIWAVKKPEGAMIDNVLKYGTGAVNVDECRVAHEDTDLQAQSGHAGGKFGRREREVTPREYTSKGRFPANLLLSHTPACREVGTKRVKYNPGGCTKFGGMFGNDSEVTSNKNAIADPDGYETIPAWECAEDCPVRLLDEQSGVSKSPGDYQRSTDAGDSKFCYGDGLGFTPAGDWHRGHGDTGGASRFFYTSKATDRDSYNDHPTLKPTDLIEWLIRLVTRPGQTVLDPFAGSGTTGVAAIQSGREFVLVEQDSHYIDICERRTTDGAQQGMF